MLDASARAVTAETRAADPRDPAEQPPTVLLADLLRSTGGAYQVEVLLSDSFAASVLECGERDGDLEMIRAGTTKKVVISFEHLRGSDPATTEVAVSVGMVQPSAKPGPG